jgi:imidazolonepropionase-like amidohydrolase
MKAFFLLIPLVALSPMWAAGQQTFPVNGVADTDHLHRALVGATVHTNSRDSVNDATVIIRDGRIVAVGTGIAIPTDAVVHDVKGRHIYPAFIDLMSDYGMPDVKKGEGRHGGRGPQYDPARPGAYTWNDALHPDRQAAALFTVNEKQSEALRKAGFGAVVTHVQDGIARGTGAFVLLADGRANENLLRERAATFFSFDKGTSQQAYPSSQMGAIALLRQSWIDAEWYQRQPAARRDANLGLGAWAENRGIPSIFITTDLYSMLRADRVGDEFKVQHILRGNGSEYQRIDEVKATGATVIVPLSFPKAFDVEDPYDAMLVPYADLLHWEMAPANAASLEKAGVPIIFTANGLDKPTDLLPALRTAVRMGLSRQKALEGLTSGPARLVGMADQIGELKPGMLANLIVTSKSIFEDKSELNESWVKGKRMELKPLPRHDLRGEYEVRVNESVFMIVIAGEEDKLKAHVQLTDTVKADAEVTFSYPMVTVTMTTAKDAKERIRLSGSIGGRDFAGNGQLQDGRWVPFGAKYIGPLKEKEKDKKGGDDKGKDDWKRPLPQGKVLYPFVGMGHAEQPKAETVFIQKATVWTNEQTGVLTEADLIMRDGRIAEVGRGLSVPPGATVVDGKGRHLTAGIIDEHSHIAISAGVNEGTQSVTSEVRIGDVVNPTDINIYRQLAGGVTAAQLLHGSANAIGGQSALIKLRWGQGAEAMKVQGADGFIKFALGENVKQSNWGDNSTTRYPQTRMGVEQVFYDAFIRAGEYQKALASKEPPRRDLELEALAEILDSRRFITCHSYVQSEVNMLMHVADSMGFKVNTFTHILEGYKVADKMREHGVSGSTFSDWWAYKYEVADAIPHNASLMHRAGVNVGINSDDAEMGRRLNQEAAKAVKYGGMSEEDALKLVTLNPAKMLHLDNRMGSLRAGKDADVVLWNGHPLSVYSTPEMTWVDGVRLFDRQRDAQMRDALAKERNRIIQLMLEAKKHGEPVRKAEKKEERLYHCETLEP